MTAKVPLFVDQAFDALCAQLVYLPAEDLPAIRAAYILAADAHASQKRRSGEPYITHPIAVAHLLADMRMDQPTILAAILHDVVEDTPVTKTEIAEQFGEHVAELVDGVTKLSHLTHVSKAQAQAAYYQKMVLAMTKDLRVILIKLADRLHNMRTIASLPIAKQRQKALETIEIFAPIAARLGMNHVRVDLEDISFAVLYPLRYRILSQAMKQAQIHRQTTLSTIEKALIDCLNQAKLSYRTVWGREKHLYSVYQKMKKNGLSFNEVMDVYGFRIILDTVDMCYRALGGIHARYKPVPGRFKDYIAVPKANGYQSLHTVLLGPDGLPIEVQLRTQPLDQLAEQGIAAHWLYKTEDQNESGLDELQHNRAKQWAKGLVALQQAHGDETDSDAFLEAFKVDLYPKEIYVFSPKGEIFALPKHSTPIDFAFSIHTDLGLHCVATKIDRQLAPLSTRMESGQTIEILTGQDVQAHPSWLNFVVTGKAKHNIRFWLKSQKEQAAMQLGRRWLEQALSVFHKTLTDVSEEKWQIVSQVLHCDSQEDLFHAIGSGQVLATLVASRLAYESLPDSLPQTDKKIIIDGTEGLALSLGHCCYPIPGDSIVGVIQPAIGLTIHRENCQEIASFASQATRCLHVRWAENISGRFSVKITLMAYNTTGVLAALTELFSRAKSDIEQLEIQHDDASYSKLTFVVTTFSCEHLDRIMKQLKHVEAVSQVYRVE